MTASNLGKSLFSRSLYWRTEGCSFQRDKQLCEPKKFRTANMAHWETICPRFTAMCDRNEEEKQCCLLLNMHTHRLLDSDKHLSAISITVNLTGSIPYPCNGKQSISGDSPPHLKEDISKSTRRVENTSNMQPNSRHSTNSMVTSTNYLNISLKRLKVTGKHL